jgi:TonB family protein
VSRRIARLSSATLVVVCCLAPAAFAAEPAKQDDTTQLKSYSVGGTKNTPKDESKVTIEKPKFDGDMGIEKPTMGAIDMTPFTVTPVTSTPAPKGGANKAAAPKPAAVAPAVVAPAPAAAVATAPARPTGAGGTTATVPSNAPNRAAPSPTGAVPQTSGATAPSMTLVPLATPAPEYPRDAMMAGTQGYVVVEFTINLEGGTQDITVVDASPQRTFDQAARRAVSRWKFQPLLENGQPVEKRVQRRIDFKL